MPWAARELDREVKWVEDRREHFVSSAHERGQLHAIKVGVRRRGPAARVGRASSGTTTARTRRTGSSCPIITVHPAARSLQARRLPRGVLVALHQHGDRHALPRRRPAAGLLRDGAHPRRDRRRARARPGRGAAAQLHHARGDALRPPADLPGRPPADLRLRRLPGVAGEAEGAGRLGRHRWPRSRRRGPRVARSASAWPATSRAPASVPTRARTSSSSRPARSRSRRGSRRRGRATSRRSRRSSPTSSACRWPTSRS